MRLISLLSLVSVAACWGELGHRTVAYVAQRHLTVPVKLWVSQLLNGEDISTAAIWPDEIKNRTKYGDKYLYASAWHFYNVEGSFEQNCTLKEADINDGCKKKGCAIVAIANNTERALNQTLSAEDRAIAMKFVLHIIGDIHQPLHTEATARGGNDICIKWGKSRQSDYPDGCARFGLDNLHSVWDDFMVERLIKEKYNLSADSSPTSNAGIRKFSDKFKNAAWLWSEKLSEPKSPLVPCPGDARTCSFGWIQESNKIVCGNVFAKGIPTREEDLSAEYYAENRDVVEVRVKVAGLRLAAWINKMYDAAKATGTYIQPEL